MIKDAFRQLFCAALEAALKLRDIASSDSALRSIRIELHAAGTPGGTLSFDAALDRLYLDENHFYKIINVAAWKTAAQTIAFVRVSGQAPCPLSQTWDPSGLGPFKPVIAEAVPSRGYEAAQ